MWTGLLEPRTRVYCGSLWHSLVEIVRQLLIGNASTVWMIGRPAEGPATQESLKVFHQLRDWLIAAGWLDPLIPLSTDCHNALAIAIPSPRGPSQHGNVERIGLAETPPAAAVLRCFTRLRLKSRPDATPAIVIVEAWREDPQALDTLYLLGDAFTERFPIDAELTSVEDRIRLLLTTQPQPNRPAVSWPREDFLRCREAALLLRPLWEAVHGVARPLAIPRCVDAPRKVAVRLSAKALAKYDRLAWIEDLQDLRTLPQGDPVGSVHEWGAHRVLEPNRTGSILPRGADGLGPLLTIAVRETPSNPVVSDANAPFPCPDAAEADGQLALWFEGLGGVRHIGPNSYLYRFGRRSVLFDAGFDATKDGWLGLPAFERLERLDAIVITHAHLDHVGSIPLLLSLFPEVPVYCTRATFEILYPTMEDSARVTQWRFEATGELPALTPELVRSLRPERFRFVEYGQSLAVPEVPGLTMTFHNAGHLIGSLYTEMQFQGVKIVHTGDISLEDSAVLEGLRLAGKSADHLVMEATYGARSEFGRTQRREHIAQFLQAVGKITDQGGSVLVPSFVLGRAQELVGLLARWNRETNRQVRIRTVGMVNRINEIIRLRLCSLMPAFDDETFSYVEPLTIGRTDLDEQQRRQAAMDAFERAAADGPCVIVASHGMMAEGTSSYLLARAILTSGGSKHGIFICGYMDPRTPGFRLLHRREQPVIDLGENDRVPRTIPAENIAYYSISSHASFEELVELADTVPTKTVTLIHGDAASLDHLRDYLQQRFQQTNRSVAVFAPAMGERIFFGRVPMPEGWTPFPAVAPAPSSPVPATVSRLDHRSGFTLSGLTADGNRLWSLFAVGRHRATVGLASKRIPAERIDRVVLRSPTAAPRTVYDRFRGIGQHDRFEVPAPGAYRLQILWTESNGSQRDVWINLLAGGELRPIRTRLSAGRPVLEILVGGSLFPRLERLSPGEFLPDLPIRRVEWLEPRRMLRISLEPMSGIGEFAEVLPTIRWANGFVQHGPLLPELTIDPDVQVIPERLQVGRPSRIRYCAVPRPIAAQVHDYPTTLTDDAIEFTPSRTGPARLFLCFPTLDGGSEWREIAVMMIEDANVSEPLRWPKTAS